MKFSVLAASLALVAASAAARPAAPFLWENATVYFLLTDRFHNGDPRNDLAYGRRATLVQRRVHDRVVGRVHSHSSAPFFHA